MSDTYGPYTLTYLEAAVDEVKDVAAWTEAHVIEVSDAIEALATQTTLVGNYTGNTPGGGIGGWDYDVEVHQFLNLVQIRGTITRTGEALSPDPISGATYAVVWTSTAVPTPVGVCALASGGAGTYRMGNFIVDSPSAGLTHVILSRAQPLGVVTIGESLAFGGTYLTASPA